MVTMKDARKRKGISQHELAKMLGVSVGAVSMYERGLREPRYKKLKMICEILDVSMDELQLKSHLPSGGQMAKSE